MRRRMMLAALATVAVLGGCTAGAERAEDDPTAAVSAGPSASPTAGASDDPTVAPTASPSESVAAADASEQPTDAAAGDEVADGEADADVGAGADADAGERSQTAQRLPRSAPGDAGRAVERLQRRLARLGFGPASVDGAYGPATERSVTAFQQLVGIPETGRAGRATVAALAGYQSDVTVLRAGDEGRAVKKLQRRLARGPLDPGPADGAYGTKTIEAVWALEKLAGLPVDGDWGPLDERALAKLDRGKLATPARSHDRRWVEFDLSEQVMTVYDPGERTPVLISHGSSGSGVPWENEEYSGTSVTPQGQFVISRRIDGWRESSLDIGRLYNPLYFNGGIAFHGATSVPLYPASHGCVRLPMHIAEYLPGELPNGTPVHVLE